jgi:peptidoglycan glycosyltransferase
MNRPIRKVAIALGVLLLALFINLNYVQVVKGSDYRNNADNQRVLLTEYSSPRGQIVVQGNAIAESVSTADELKYKRVYPDGKLYAPVTGFYSFIYGNPRGIENAEDSVLSGKDSRLVGTQLADLLTGRNPEGGSVDLTLNRAAQEAAYQAMKGSNGRMRRGAIVALDPTTGAILAAVSTPSYDPSKLSSHNADAITAAWKAYNSAAGKPMLNRAFSELYPPGSVFKVIVSAAMLHNGVTPDQRIPAPNSYWPYGGSGKCPADHRGPCVENFDGETCDNGKTATLEFAFAKSCNTAFAAYTVDELGGTKLAEQARLFGFDDQQLQIPMSVATSVVGSHSDLTDAGKLAHTSFGQQDVRITPLQGAMIAAAVANDGRLMQPYLVAKERKPNLNVLDQTQPSQLSQAIDPDLDSQLQEMMHAVVTSREGTGHAADITDLPGVLVGGKTGTADTGIYKNGKETPPHAWFSGYALQNGTPKIAVAVIIENGGVNGNETTGGLAAAPVAKAVMEAYLKSIGGK